MYRVKLEGLSNSFITDVSDEEYIEYSSIDGGALRYADDDTLVEPERAEFLCSLLELVEPDEYSTVTYTANWIQPPNQPVRWIAEDIEVSQD
jgi:hypothetical protein